MTTPARLEAQLRDQLARLIATRSVSSADPALDCGNRAVVDLLAGWCEARGFAVELQSVGRHADKLNLIATRGSGEGGLVLAGAATVEGGDDRADELGAELRGLSTDAERALRQLQLGAWEQLHVECEGGALALAPVREGAVALVATGAETPAGLTRLLLDRARRTSNTWMSAL